MSSKMKVDAGKIERAEVLKIFPENLVIDNQFNSRVVPHSDDEVKAMAQSILDNRQIQPCVGRRIADNKVQLVLGYGRAKAVNYINGVLRPENPIPLEIKVVDMNAEEAFVLSIIENSDRVAVTPMDDAHAQRRLRDDFGWDDNRIAELYKKSVAYISQLRKTLQLPTDIQAEVKNGNMAIGAAIEITALESDQERREVVAEAKNPETGKVSTETVRAAVRNKKIASGKGATSRSMKEVKATFEGMTGPAESLAIRTLASQMLKFISGRIKEETLLKAFALHTKPDAKVEPAEAA